MPLVSSSGLLVLVLLLGFLLAPMRNLGPHLANVLQDHVAVPVEGFHAREDLAVVAAVDEDLRVVLEALLENRQGAHVEVVLVLDLSLLRHCAALRAPCKAAEIGRASCRERV